jgi:hypothetical protein
VSISEKGKKDARIASHCLALPQKRAPKRERGRRRKKWLPQKKRTETNAKSQTINEVVETTDYDHKHAMTASARSQH